VRLAVLSDIHGNLEALTAVLEHAAKRSVDGFVVVGDIVVGGADSLACWERVAALRCPVLRGNHETYVAALGTAAAAPQWSTPQFAPVAWSAAQLGDAVCRTLGELPFNLSLPYAPETLFVHASLRSDRDNLDAYTPESTLSEMFPGLCARYVVRGHDHHAAVRAWSGRSLITNGSVGIPLGGVSEAQYLILTISKEGVTPTFYTVPYDVEGALERFHETGYLAEAGPMAHLFYREIATASPQLIPFLRGYARDSQGEKLGLEDAVRAFLRFGSP
jgi:predicted phosphodiesterase